jgi:hypothetical protein
MFFKEVTTAEEFSKMLKLNKDKVITVFYLKGEWFDERQELLDFVQTYAFQNSESSHAFFSIDTKTTNFI